MTVSSPRSAILLVNLGTPDAPTPAALRRYLDEFLSDPRVIDVTPRWWWWLILHGVILRIRPARSAAAYRKVWREDGSPLRVHSEALMSALTAHFTAAGDAREVHLAMRYGTPSVASVMADLQRRGIDDITLLPLYPQFSHTTVTSVEDAFDAALAKLHYAPSVTRIRGYHLDDGWLGALAAHVRAHWQQHGRGEHLLVSFHGIPERYARAGDPYHTECLASGQALIARLGLDADQASVTFQSRFGREPWLQPYTDVTLRALAARGVKRVDVVCPGFAVDCLETLEEISLRYAEQFRAAGGQHLGYIPALNGSADHAQALAGIIRAARSAISGVAAHDAAQHSLQYPTPPRPDGR